MKVINKVNIMLAASLLLSSGMTIPMWRSAFRKAKPWLSFGALASPFWILGAINGFPNYGDAFIDKYAPKFRFRMGIDNPSAERVIDYSIKKMGVSNPNSIRKKIICGFPSPAACRNGVLIINEDYYDRLCKAIDSNDKKKINEFIFLFEHEINHHINKDSNKLAALAFASPVITEAACRMRNAILKPVRRSGFRSIPFNVSAFCGKFLFTGYILMSYSKKCEHRADIVEPDKDVIEGGIRLFKNFDREQKKVNILRSFWKDTFNILRSFLQDTFDTHPTLKSRVERQQKRLNSLPYTHPNQIENLERNELDKYIKDLKKAKEDKAWSGLFNKIQSFLLKRW